MIREVIAGDLEELLELYLYLHETEIPENSEQLINTWSQIIDDPNYHIIVCEIDGRIAASCTCVVIPNLTRGVSPYALVENVVTHADFRGKRYATACLDRAKQIAIESGCYKIMLLTGSKSEKTLNFYKNAGYNDKEKTAFIIRFKK